MVRVSHGCPASLRCPTATGVASFHHAVSSVSVFTKIKVTAWLINCGYMWYGLLSMCRHLSRHSPLGRYHLVKLLEKFGNVKQFDFLFHKSGPLEGQPRGYCFVNFNTREVGAHKLQRWVDIIASCLSFVASVSSDDPTSLTGWNNAPRAHMATGSFT